jgi:predicted enzyme related to lactoylglutathione lyase
MTGRVVHFDIPYDDVRARAFYAEVFGWEVMPMEGMEYMLAMTGPSGDQGPTEPGYVNGGMPRRGGNITAPTLVIEVDDIEDALSSVEKKGGSVVEGRRPVGRMGFTAIFKDSEGNLMSLWETNPDGPA